MQQLLEGGDPSQSGAQDQGVDEEADERLDLWTGAVGDGGAHGQIVLSAVTTEQELTGGQQAHKEGDPFLLTQRLHLLAEW